VVPRNFRARDLYFEPKYEEFRSRTILESVECVHVGVQRIGPHPSIQGDGQAGRVSAGAVLAVVLTYGGLGRRIFPSFRRWSGANHADGDRPVFVVDDLIIAGNREQ
jgi:hypothetical protein